MAEALGAPAAPRINQKLVGCGAFRRKKPELASCKIFLLKQFRLKALAAKN